MNSVRYRPSSHLGITLKPCHPERSLAMSEANCQTESKDPYRPDTTRTNERNFLIAIRFLDERETELRPVSNREAAAGESPARQCRGCVVDGTSPAGTAPLHENSRMTQ